MNDLCSFTGQHVHNTIKFSKLLSIHSWDIRNSCCAFERMLGRGHKRSRSHFSEFTIVPQSPRPVGGDRKQQSEESQAAKIQARRSLGHKKSFSTTSLIAIAGTVVTTDALKYPDLVFSPSNSVAMARPRSPQKKHDAEYDKMELMLDKKLLAIREQLSALSIERAKMERQMDTLTNEIREAHTQCYNRKHLVQQASQTSLRRVQSVGENRINGAKLLRYNSKDDIDGTSPTVEDSINSVGSTSQVSVGESPLVASGCFGDSVSSRSSTSSYSFSTGRSISSLSIPKTATSGLSVDVFADDCSTIPELPESPKWCSPRMPQLSSKLPSPASQLHLSFTVTSTPDLVKNQNQNHRSSPRMSSQRKSLPETAISKLRFKDSVDSLNGYDSLSQVSCCTDDGSPKSSSSLILRRSSLTGQIEHIRRREIEYVKRKSNYSSSEKLLLESGQLSSSLGNVCDASREYKVLNKGHRSRSRYPYKKQIILTSVETTV